MEGAERVNVSDIVRRQVVVCAAATGCRREVSYCGTGKADGRMRRSVSDVPCRRSHESSSEQRAYDDLRHPTHPIATAQKITNFLEQAPWVLQRCNWGQRRDNCEEPGLPHPSLSSQDLGWWHLALFFSSLIFAFPLIYISSKNPRYQQFLHFPSSSYR